MLTKTSNYEIQDALSTGKNVSFQRAPRSKKLRQCGVAQRGIKGNANSGRGKSVLVCSSTAGASLPLDGGTSTSISWMFKAQNDVANDLAGDTMLKDLNCQKMLTVRTL